jgi:predicted MFS family arabinose efflux permease
MASRTVANTLVRFPYVLLAPLARGFGISITAATAVLGVRELGGLFTPIAAHHADSGHERRTMVITLAAAGSCLAVATIGTRLWLFTVLMFLSGCAKFSSDVAQSAFVSHRVPFARRSRVIGLTETTWAVAFLTGVPLTAWLTDRWNWQLPYIVVGLAILASAGWLRWAVPADQPHSVAPRHLGWRPPRRALPLLVFAAAQPAAQMMLFAVSGAWFEQHLGFRVNELGVVAILIGLGELIGTGTPALIGDRLGGRRLGILGAGLAIPLAGCLALVGGRSVFGVAVVVLTAIGLEITFVAALPLISEVDLTNRASMLAVAIGLGTATRALTSAVAGWVYESFGIAMTGAATAGLLVIALAGLIRFRLD